jgi:hypothetical protein
MSWERWNPVGDSEALLAVSPRKQRSFIKRKATGGKSSSSIQEISYFGNFLKRRRNVEMPFCVLIFSSSPTMKWDTMQ